MPGCSAPMMGGRRRRTSKRKTMKGGNFYGFDVDNQIGSAGAARPAVPNPAVNSATGAAIPEYATTGGRRRRRSSRKGTKKGARRMRRRRTMRGGAGFYSIAGVGAGYAGQGAAGLADYTGYSTKGPVAGGSTQGADGVMKSS